MLLKLALNNWKSHKETVVKFTPGINLLIGPMGAGKSSIIEAVCYTLFGTFPALRRKNIKLAEISNYYLNTDTSVELTFSVEKDTYHIIRKIRNGKSDAIIYKNNTLVEKGGDRVNDYIVELLETDYETFVNAIFSEQNKIDVILTSDPKTRKEQIDELLGINKLENARKNCVSAINKLKYALNNIEVQLKAINKESIEREFTQNQKNIEELETKETITQRSLAEKKRYLEETKTKYTELKTKIDAKTKLEKELNMVIGRIESLSAGIDKQIDYVEKYNKIKKAYAELSEKLGKLDSVILNMSRESSSIEKEIAQIKKTLSDAELQQKEIEKLEKELASISESPSIIAEEISTLEKNLAETNERIGIVQNETKKLEEAIKKLSESKGECPVCNTLLSSEKISELIEKNKGDLIRLGEEITKLKHDKKTIEERLIEKRKKTKKLEELTLLINEKKKRLVDTEALIKTITWLEKQKEEKERQLLAERDNQKKLLKDQQELNREIRECELTINAIKEINSLLSQKKLLESEVEKLQVSQQEYEESMKIYELALIEFKNCETELRSITENKKHLLEKRDYLNKRLNEITSFEKKHSKITKALADITSFKEVVTVGQATLRTTVIEALNLKMNDLWQQLYPYKDITEICILPKENDYLFLAKKKDYVEIYNLSGGEKSCVALAFRLALVYVLTPKLSLLVLDEPTHNLDEEAIRTLGMLLEERIPSLIDQTIVITHDKELMRENYGNTIALIRNKEKDGFSEITKTVD